MANMKATVDLGDPDKLRRTIVRRAAKRAAADAATTVRDTVKAAVEKAVAAEIDAAVKKEVRAIAERVFSEPVRKTDSYGQPKGEAKSMREWLTDEARAGLSRKVDYKGEPDNGYGSDKKTFLEWALSSIAENWLRKNFNEDLKKAVEDAHARIATDCAAVAFNAVKARAEALAKAR